MLCCVKGITGGSCSSGTGSHVATFGICRRDNLVTRLSHCSIEDAAVLDIVRVAKTKYIYSNSVVK